MTVYYTAKDIEELDAKGLKKLDVGPGVTLTDFARETAEQLGFELVEVGQKSQRETPVMSSFTPPGEKPRGCQHGPITPSSSPPTNKQTAQTPDTQSSGGVKKLVEIMSDIMNRGD